MPAAELTELHVRQMAAHRAGDRTAVRLLFNRMLPLLNFQAVFRMAMTKEVLRRRGVITAAHVRAAGPKLDPQDHRELGEMLAEIVDLLPKMVDILDEPIGDPAAINTFLMCQAARERGVKVILSGMGADELFGGYRKHLACLMASRYHRLPAAFRIPARASVNALPVSCNFASI